MAGSVFKALFVLGQAAVAVYIGGYAVWQFTGRAQFESCAPEAAPLHFRMGGYDAVAATAYWDWLGPEGRRVERRFLAVDFAFPVLYGGSILAGLLLARRWLGRPMGPGWLIAPVAMALAADWAENVIHWRQLGRYLQGEPVQEGWIRFASLATAAKLTGFWASALLLVGLSVWLMARRFAGRRPGAGTQGD